MTTPIATEIGTVFLPVSDIAAARDWYYALTGNGPLMSWVNVENYASQAVAQRLGAKRTYFTHMCHDVPHAETQQSLPPNIYLAYDELEIQVDTAE